MNQCVPSWDLDDNPASAPILTPRAHSNSSLASLDYEVAELTWENGQLSMHGLGHPRVTNKPPTTWDKPRSGGTLESIVDQATLSTVKSATTYDCAIISNNELVPWFNHHRRSITNPAPSESLTVTMDALVPCSNNLNDCSQQSMHVLESAPTGTGMVGCSTGVGSCNTTTRVGRVPHLEFSKTNLSLSESGTCGGTDSRFMTIDDTCGLGSASTSPDNSSGKEYSKTSADDSVCHRGSMQRKGGHRDDEKKKKFSAVSTKRSRAAAIHNQSERKRRDKINQRMKTLQKMVPNSSKTDKASMLDEVIEYLKQLQAQINMMSRMSMPSMMLPLAMQQQQLQMSMMGMGMGMGMGIMGMDMNTMSRAAAGMLPPSSIMPDPLTAFLACQTQPMNMDAYSRLTAMYQQFQQNPGSAPKH